jgi:hypothetical protein
VLILVLCSWRALRVQKSPNVDESRTSSREVASSPAPSVSVSNTSFLEGFDDENGEEMDLEELSKAFSEAATFASHSKKPQRKRQSKTNLKPTTVSPRTSMVDTNTLGMVITWIKLRTYISPSAFCCLIFIFYELYVIHRPLHHPFI